ncbi:MAG: TRAP transporter small permease subunit [Betaproteobacteria bacterium]|nr:TRAP transporter small permease subunit [Betaproteobacteria bacterium]
MERLFDASGRIAQALAVLTKILLAAIVLLVCADVAARNLSRPMAWSVTLTEYLLVYITFLPMPALVRGKGHVCADFIRTALPGRLRRGIERGVYLLCLAICLYLGGIALSSALATMRSGAYEVRSFDMPRWLIFAPMAIGLWLSALEFLRYLVGRDSIYAIDVREMEGF